MRLCDNFILIGMNLLRRFIVKRPLQSCFKTIMLKIFCARYEIKEDIAWSIIQTNLFQKHHKVEFETRMFSSPM